MYLVNHLFEKEKKRPHPSASFQFLSQHFFFPFSLRYPHPPEDLPATSQGSFLICRENKLVVLFPAMDGRERPGEYSSTTHEYLLLMD